MAWYDEYIGQIPCVVGGEPVNKGTRVSVLAVVEYWALYRSLAKLAEILPDVSQECIRAALAYYKDYETEIEHCRREDEESDRGTDEIPNIFRLGA